MICVHFLHHQLFNLYKIAGRVQRRQLLGSIRNAIQWCVFLTTDPLIIPATDLIHSPLMPEIAGDLHTLVAFNAVEFVGSSLDRAEIASQVLDQHKDLHNEGRLSVAAAKRRLRGFEPALRRRRVPTTLFVVSGWTSAVTQLTSANSSFSIDQLRHARNALPRNVPTAQFVAMLKDLPERLGSHAFRWDVVEELGAFDYETTPQARTHFELALGWQWLASYVDEYDAQIVASIPGIGPIHCGLQRTHPQRLIDLRKYDNVLRSLGLDGPFYALSLEEMLLLRFEPRVALLRDAIIDRVTIESSASINREPRDDIRFAAASDDIRRETRLATSAKGAVLRAAAVSTKWAITQRHDLVTRSRASAPSTVGLTAESVLATSTTVGPMIVAVVVALSEELSFIIDAVEAVVGPVTIDRTSPTGQLAYIVERTTKNAQAIRFVFTLVGRGQERAAAQTTIVVQEQKPHIVVSLGIAGALSSDVATGDIAVGQEVRSYLANAKARPDGKGHFEFALAGESVSCDALLVSRADQLSLTSREGLAIARSRQRSRADTLASLAEFRIFCGPLACGPAVSAADEFKEWLIASKRDYLAVDMESSGAGIASAVAGMLRPVRFVAIRGISDGGDRNKNILEAETKGAARRLATTAALEVLLLLIDDLPSLEMQR